MSRRLTYWLAHIFIYRYISLYQFHSKHLQFSFLFFVQWFSLYSIYRIKIFFRGRYFYINFPCNNPNDNKLQIEWHYFGLLKVLLKLSTNSKHSARLSVSFRVRKSTGPNWVLDIFVNSLTIRNKSFARVYWSKSPMWKYMWFGSFVQVLKDQKDILPCPYLENMQKIKAAWKDTWMFSQCSVSVSVAQCCNQMIEIHTRPM